MTEFFQSGRAVDVILLIVGLEVLALTVWPRLRGAMRIGDVIALVLPGVMLLLALRAALTGTPHTITAAILAAAFACHLWDVSRRRQATPPTD